MLLLLPCSSGVLRYEMAASFFILADQYWDAVGVLAHEHKDPQLALFVARLLQGGPGGACSQRLVHEVKMGYMAETNSCYIIMQKCMNILKHEK
jgi:hypothetical protein